MFRKLQPFFIIAESPVHAGSGSELGVVDLPIQRERYTNFPKIESSGLKGCIREAIESVLKNSEEEKELVSLLFGPEEGDAHAGAISFTDAKILCFPVKSLKGVFVWITCPMILTRFIEDMKVTGKEDDFKDWNITGIQNTLPKGSNALLPNMNKIVLEEFTFEVKESDEASIIAEKLSQIVFPQDKVYSFWKGKMKKDLVILSDDDFADFVSTSTEVVTRTKISNVTGTVERAALWTEEFLPQDSILYSIAMTSPVWANEDKKGIFKGINADDEAQKVLDFFNSHLLEIIHIGGNQTIGKGIVTIKLWEEQK